MNCKEFIIIGNNLSNYLVIDHKTIILDMMGSKILMLNLNKLIRN